MSELIELHNITERKSNGHHKKVRTLGRCECIFVVCLMPLAIAAGAAAMTAVVDGEWCV